MRMHTKTGDDPAIIIRDVSRRFGKEPVIHRLSFEIKKGELFGVLGPDGAGKTTLLRMIAGVLNPTDLNRQGMRGRIAGFFKPPQGHIQVMGYDTVAKPEAVKSKLGYMPQAFGLYGDLSVDENLTFAADVFAVTQAERTARIKELLSFAGLTQFRERRAAQLSGGMKKKLALACALLHRPDVLLLDEPTTGVDPVARREFWDLLSGLHSEGITTLVTTPYMDEAERCNRVVLLYEGELLASGTPQAIKAQIPGKVLTVKNVDIRTATSHLKGMSNLIDIQTYGDQLNLIIGGDFEQVKAEVEAKLQEANFREAQFGTMSVRMEEAFIYLVNAEKGKSA